MAQHPEPLTTWRARRGDASLVAPTPPTRSVDDGLGGCGPALVFFVAIIAAVMVVGGLVGAALAGATWLGWVS